MSRRIRHEEHAAACVRGDSIAESIKEAIEEYESSSLNRVSILEALANVSACAIFQFYKKQGHEITNQSANWFVEKFVWYLNKYLDDGKGEISDA